MDIRNDRNCMSDIIENENRIIEHKENIVDAIIIACRIGDNFHKPYRVIGKITDTTAGESRKSWQVNSLVRVHDTFQFTDRVAAEAPFKTSIEVSYCARISSCTENEVRVCAEERISGHFFSAFNAF